MSFNKEQFEDVVRTALEKFDSIVPVSDSAVNLLLGTAAQESHFGTYLRQLNDGPALGVFQMEPATYGDIWENFIRHRDGMRSWLQLEFGANQDSQTMIHNLHYATIMARIHYYRVPDPLPAWQDVGGLAHYWKRHYNTILGAGTEDEFIENYERFVE